jgi:tetratricopeptide (TPR) repeat protein
MNSGLTKNALSALVGIVMAFLLVLQPWLGLAAIVGVGIIYYRTVQMRLRRRQSLARSRSQAMGDSNLPTPDIEPAVAYLNRGRSLYAQQDYVGAMSDFDRVIWIDHDCRTAYYFRALCLLAVEELDQAAIDLEVAKDLAMQHHDEQLLAEIDRVFIEIPQNQIPEISSTVGGLPELN